MKKKLLILTLIILSILIFTDIATASENKNTFNVNPIYPSNQIKNTIGYFHVSANESSAEQDLSYKVENLTDQAITLESHFVNAYTGQGIIIYDKDKLEESTLDEKYLFTNYVTNNEKNNKIKLNPHESKVVSFKVNVPKLDGSLLGGIAFEEVKDKEELNDSTDNSKGENQASFIVNTTIEKIIAVRIDMNTKTLSNEIEITDIYFDRNNLYATIENSYPSIIKGGKGVIKVKDEKDEVVFEHEIKNFDMSPKTLTSYAINLNGDIESGKYQAEMSLKVNEEEFKKTKEIKIIKQELHQTQNLFSSPVPIEQNSTIYIVITVVILIVLTLIFFIFRQRKIIKNLKEDHSKE